MNAILPATDTSWVKRNLFLFIALLVATVLLGGGIIVAGVFGLIKSSDAYKLGFAQAAANPVVIEAIGAPVEAGMFITGNIRTSGSAGRADLSIPVHGPKGTGNVYMHAQRSLGEWTLTALVFENDTTRQRTDLLHQDDKAPASP